METGQNAPFNTNRQDRHAWGRTTLLALAIRDIPLRCDWRTKTAAMANEYLKQPIFEHVNCKFDAECFEQAVRELESGVGSNIQAYVQMLGMLKSKTGLDPMQDPFVKRHQTIFAQECFKKTFGILALAWVLESKESTKKRTRIAEQEGEACSTSQ